MPKTSRRTNSPAAPDVMRASVTQLARLTAEVLRLHLASRHLVTTGTKAVMAQRLHDAIHAAPVSQQQSDPALPRQEYTPTSQLPTVTQQLPLFPPPPASLPVTSPLPLNVSSVLTRPIALSQIASSLPTTANSTDLAQLFNQFLRQATGQSTPQALSPASIDGNQQTQPTTALQPAHNLQLPPSRQYQYSLQFKN